MACNQVSCIFRANWTRFCCVDTITNRKFSWALPVSFFGGLFSDYCIFFSFSTEPQVTYLIRKEFKMTNLDLDVDVLCGKTTIQWELLWLPKVPFLGWSAFSYYWRTARPFSCAPAHSSPLIWLSLQLTALLITKRRPLGTSSTLTFNNLCNQSKSNYSA